MHQDKIFVSNKISAATASMIFILYIFLLGSKKDNRLLFGKDSHNKSDQCVKLLVVSKTLSANQCYSSFLPKVRVSRTAFVNEINSPKLK